MRGILGWTVVVCGLMASGVAVGEETVQLSRSSYFQQHVTVEDRKDHFMVHFNAYVKLDEAPESTRLLHANVYGGSSESGFDVIGQKRSVQLEAAESTWSFYFRVEKFAPGSDARYAVVVKVDGVQDEAKVVWRIVDGRLDLGTADDPLSFMYPVGREIRQQVAPDRFRLMVVYEVKSYPNNYESLPVCGLLLAGKMMPDVVDSSRSAQKISP